MSESIDPDSVGAQGPVPVKGLQRPLDERNGLCHDDISTGVHVPGHSALAHLHELCRTDSVFTHPVCDRNTSVISYVQEEFQVRK